MGTLHERGGGEEGRWKEAVAGLWAERLSYIRAASCSGRPQEGPASHLLHSWSERLRDVADMWHG